MCLRAAARSEMIIAHHPILNRPHPLPVLVNQCQAPEEMLVTSQRSRDLHLFPDQVSVEHPSDWDGGPARPANARRRLPRFGQLVNDFIVKDDFLPPLPCHKPNGGPQGSVRELSLFMSMSWHLFQI